MSIIVKDMDTGTVYELVPARIRNPSDGPWYALREIPPQPEQYEAAGVLWEETGRMCCVARGEAYLNPDGLVAIWTQSGLSIDAYPILRAVNEKSQGGSA